MNFIPTVLDRSIYDEIIIVSDEEAYAAGRASPRTRASLPE